MSHIGKMTIILKPQIRIQQKFRCVAIWLFIISNTFQVKQLLHFYQSPCIWNIKLGQKNCCWIFVEISVLRFLQCKKVFFEIIFCLSLSRMILIKFGIWVYFGHLIFWALFVIVKKCKVSVIKAKFQICRF